MTWAVEAGASAAAAALAAAGAAVAAVRLAPARLERINVNGRRVPAVLGLAAVAAAAAVTAGAASVGASGVRARAAVAILVVVMAAAGLADDRRGAEAERGFRGHLAAAARGRITGGLVKIAAGAAAGLAAGAVVSEGRDAVEIALCCALTANLVNLTDRAPGRAVKVFAAITAPVAALGDAAWAVAAAPVAGAVAGIAPADLRERGMLGDAGSNPIGAVAGLGLGMSLPEPWRVAAIAVLIGLNAASERISFSDLIERTTWLRRIDLAGRRPPAK